MRKDSINSEMRAFSFGPFVLEPDRQVLKEGTKPVRIGVRSLEILTTLVERAGELVTKDELIARVWPDTFVDESNVKVNIAALRRALGDTQAAPRYVATTSGRGYRFIAPVKACVSDFAAASETTAPKHNLPVQTRRVYGRGETIQTLTDRLALHRLVTVTGTGGVGKTTVALSVATEVLNRFGDGVWFIDLAPLHDPLAVPRSLSSLLGITLDSEGTVEALRDYLRNRKVLIVFDNCEHLIGPIACLVEELLQHTHNVHILATSREPLCITGEQVCRLPALPIPPKSSALAISEALHYPGVELFLERAAACAGYRLTAEDVPIVSDICRKMDGNALAIELAAACLDSLTPGELSALLGNQLSLLSRGSRTAPERHRTLTSTLDWSFELLTDNERVLLGRLAVFEGSFPLESAKAVTSGGRLGQAEIVESLAGLVSKSLVSVEFNTAVTLYSLPDTTRAYALGKLQDCGEEALYLRRYSEYKAERARRIKSELYSFRSTNRAPRSFSPLGRLRNVLRRHQSRVPVWLRSRRVEIRQRRVYAWNGSL